MPRRIEILPDSVANQIAAGEVVERPASVAKELVENALDARATRVEVALEHGGKRSIRVADDGIGMGREDALLAFDRHATSKIADAGDLRSVRTLGFRGEALPSIAAVSRVTVETAEEDGEGTRVRLEGGEIVGVDDAPRRRGTTVEVRNLFFNAPARKKFLSSTRAESRAVSDVLSTQALASPSVAFTLTSNDRRLLEVEKARDVARRIAGIWGDEEARDLIPVTGAREAMELRGLIERPDAVGPGFRRAHLFVDGRPFRDPALLAAAERGYRTTIPPGGRPSLFLFLNVPSGSVDVNVHPAKAEVKFRDPDAVETLVEESVREALAGEESSATLDAQLAPPRMPPAVREAPAGAAADGGEEADGGEAPATEREARSQMALFLGGEELTVSSGEEGGEGAAAEVEASPEPARLWQLHDTWILAETRDGLLIIDQHSAHERVLFERLMRGFAEGGGGAQRLLFPLTLRLAPAEYEQVEELEGLLSRAGFEVEGFGGDTVIVHAVPNPHPYFDPERCFREMVEELAHGSELVRSARNQHERIAKTFACKGAIKAGRTLGTGEMEELFDALFATELPFHDVHGRPTIVRLSRGELERKFGR